MHLFVVSYRKQYQSTELLSVFYKLYLVAGSGKVSCNMRLLNPVSVSTSEEIFEL
jgi:hypothetical protein